MIKRSLEIEGSYLLKSSFYEDERGSYRKILSNEIITELDFKIQEMNFINSKQNSIRGLHMYKDATCDKIFFIISGSVVNLQLDTRTNSKTYGKYLSTHIDDSDLEAILIPSGVANGFYFKEDSKIAYIQNLKHSDSEIVFSPKYFYQQLKISNPIISKKDNSSKQFKLN